MPRRSTKLDREIERKVDRLAKKLVGSDRNWLCCCCPTGGEIWQTLLRSLYIFVLLVAVSSKPVTRDIGLYADPVVGQAPGASGSNNNNSTIPTGETVFGKGGELGIVSTAMLFVLLGLSVVASLGLTLAQRMASWCRITPRDGVGIVDGWLGSRIYLGVLTATYSVQLTGALAFVDIISQVPRLADRILAWAVAFARKKKSAAARSVSRGVATRRRAAVEQYDNNDDDDDEEDYEYGDEEDAEEYDEEEEDEEEEEDVRTQKPVVRRRPVTTSAPRVVPGQKKRPRPANDPPKKAGVKLGYRSTIAAALSKPDELPASEPVM
jgi:hypothetical protein